MLKTFPQNPTNRSYVSCSETARALGYEAVDLPPAGTLSDDTRLINTATAEFGIHPELALAPERGVYVSGDEVEFAAALKMGYSVVCQHPREVGALLRDEVLVIDANTVMFGDLAEVVRVAFDAAKVGVRVGIHTFNREHPLLASLAKMPNVTIAKTHRDLLAAMR